MPRTARLRRRLLPVDPRAYRRIEERLLRDRALIGNDRAPAEQGLPATSSSPPAARAAFSPPG